MQYKVPQHIEMEDKIIGPLTMKQFVYLLVGGMIAYATIKTYNTALIIFVGIPIAILALCLAFIKVQDRPFSNFLFSLALYITKPKQRIWRKDWKIAGMDAPIVQKSPEIKKEIHEEKHVGKSQLQKLSYILDTKGQEQAIAQQLQNDAPKLNTNKTLNNESETIIKNN